MRLLPLPPLRRERRTESPPRPAPTLERVEDVVSRDARWVREGVLQPGCASFLRRPEGPPKGAVLLLHGLTGGTWQFEDALVDSLRSAGMCCYGARLTGHGRLRRGVPDASALPQAGQKERYHEFAERAFARTVELAQRERVPLYMVGFSAGGALATRIAMQHPTEVCRQVLVDPYLAPVRPGPQARLEAAFFDVTQALRRRRMAAAIAPLPMRYRRAPEPHPGNWYFRLGNLLALMEFGTDVWDRGPKRLVPPTQFILTEAGSRCDAAPAQTICDADPGRHASFVFGPGVNVPHGMLNAYENKDPESRARVRSIIRDFLADGRPTHGRLDKPLPPPTETRVGWAWQTMLGVRAGLLGAKTQEPAGSTG